jgi:hypothetical protein
MNEYLYFVDIKKNKITIGYGSIFLLKSLKKHSLFCNETIKMLLLKANA